MNRIKELDVLRGIAVLLVLGRHVQGPPGWGRIGWMGVDAGGVTPPVNHLREHEAGLRESESARYPFNRDFEVS